MLTSILEITKLPLKINLLFIYLFILGPGITIDFFHIRRQGNKPAHLLAKHASMTIVEGKFFTPHGFISLATRTISILSWILGEYILKPKTHGGIISSRPIVRAHGTTSHFWLMIQAHESHRGNFGSRGLEGQEVCSVKLQWFKVDTGKHVAWHVFPNSLNSDGSVCKR